MFDFIGNAVRNLVNDIEYQITETSFKKAEKEFDAWGKEYEARVEKINAIDPDSNAARQWCIDNHDLTTGIENRIRELVPEYELQYGVGYYRKAHTGMQCALAALRSIHLQDEEGFPVWPKDMRIAETAIRKFFGKQKYPNYDDISDNDIPALKELTKFENSCDCWICDETIEEAFRRVQGDPKIDITVDIENGSYEYKLVGEEEPRERIEGDVAESTNSSQQSSKSEATSDLVVIKDDPNVIDAEIIDGKVTPIHFGDDAMDMAIVQFFQEQDENRPFVSCEPGVPVWVYNSVEKFLNKNGFSEKRRLYRTPNPAGFVELVFENGQAIIIDPGNIAGTGVNFVASAMLLSANNKLPIFVSVIVSPNSDPDIAKKIVQDPEYVLEPGEHARAFSRLFQKHEIYDYIDFSGMSKHLSKMTKDEELEFIKWISAIVNLMMDKTIAACRFRFYKFNAPNDFVLVSDKKVKMPLQSSVRIIIPWVFVVSNNTISHRVLESNGAIGKEIGNYHVEF